jgi:hypothetical protein
MAVSNLNPPLSGLRTQLPGARYLVFGFGDRGYLMNKGRGLGALLGAIWPGEGLVLVTGLAATPEQAFGEQGVVRLMLSPGQALALQQFIWGTLQPSGSIPQALAPGPYDGSFYFAAKARYSGLHTCNTWTAEGLSAAGLDVSSVGVEFAAQIWRQAHRLKVQQNAAARGSPAQQHSAGVP